NREDVGKRMFEILIPVPKDRTVADQYSAPFKKYYSSLEESRKFFIKSLSESEFNHHIHLGE
ncbi:MAG: hypothetical protein AAFY30_06125, partial [Cyanobacteria bacterium J06642_12]